MSVSHASELTHAKQLIFKVDFTEALRIVKTLETKEGLLTHEQLTSQLLKCTILNELGHYKDTLNVIGQVLQECQAQDFPLLHLDALIILAEVLGHLGRFTESLNVIEQGENYSKTISEALPIELTLRQATLYYLKGVSYLRQGDLEQALKYFELSLILREFFDNKQNLAKSLNRIGTVHYLKGDLDKALDYFKNSLFLKKQLNNKQELAKSFNNLGEIYRQKGDLAQALDYYQQSLRLKEQFGNNYRVAISLHNIALIFQQQGNLEQALQNNQQSLELFEEIGDRRHMSGVIFCLFSIAIDKNDLEMVQYYLQRLQQLNDEEENKIINQRYRIAEALVMKTSTRLRKKFKAAEILRQVVEEEIADHELTVLAMLNLCELLLFELKSLEEVEILQDVKPLTQRLFEIARQQHSYSLLAETYVLKARLALMDLNIQETRQLFTQAQFIAEEKGLGRLALKISTEHDVLLEQLNTWEEIRKQNASLSERADLALLEDILKHMIRKQPIEVPKLPEEEPVLFLILTGTGTCLFSRSFRSESKLPDQIVGGFLSAIQTFSTQVFAKTLDRIKFQDYTLFMKVEGPFLICYIFKGYSYPAQQKLSQVIKQIRTNNSIWHLLKRAMKIGRVLRSKETGDLESLLTEIFDSNEK
ncbi:MAG: tetratricopeptide repeat protein [Candidatus Hodarchaeota archaeon]